MPAAHPDELILLPNVANKERIYREYLGVEPTGKDEFVFYTNNTGLRGLVENITFSFSAFVPTKIIIDYIGIRTNRNIEISSNNAFISRND